MSGKNPVTRFLGFIWRVLERLVKSIQVLVFLFVLVIVFSAVSNLRGGGIKVPESAALVIKPAGALVEQPEGEPLDRALIEMQEGDAQAVVRDIVDSLHYAADDERIKVVVLLPGSLSDGGLSKLQAIGAAISEFKASGKRVIAMADNYDQTQYYLASQADEIYMHDFGLVIIEGYSYFRAYFASAIEKLKVDVNVFRVGQFKSFVEPYLRNDMSEEDKVAASRWLGALWEMYRRDITAARAMQPEAFDAYVNDLPTALREANGNAAEAAVNNGFIDGLMDHQQFRNYIIDMVGADEEEHDSFAQIDYQTYVAAMDAANVSVDQTQKQVAVIVASGEIVDGEASPGTVGSETLALLIRQAANDDQVAAVVLRVDSPGGSMFASEVIYDELMALKERGKPVVASMGSVAASGGYYISLAADEIWAAESTVSGSIGVGAMFPTFQRTLAELGVSIDGFGTTQLSGQFTPLRELGDDAEDLLDISIRSAYDVFTGKVADARSMDIGRVDEIAQGRVWIGGDAFELGLIDNIGGVESAIEAAASRAGLAEGEYRTQYVHRELSFAERLLLQYAKLFDMLFSVMGPTDSGFVAILQRLSGSALGELAAFDQWNDPRGMYYRCPCDLR